MKAKSIARNYFFLMILLLAMVLGAITGYVYPEFASSISFLGRYSVLLGICKELGIDGLELRKLFIRHFRAILVKDDGAILQGVEPPDLLQR